MLASVTSLLSKDGVNVENMTNKSKGEYAYTVVDVNTEVGADTAEKIRSINGILRVRLIKV
jgi:D-3-phosphoglycerate dehydrogenase